MKISLKLEDKVVTATLIDHETTRDFVALLLGLPIIER